MADAVPRVSGLNIFPIKSCKAVKMEEVELDSFGVVGDRRLMLVDRNGRFTSQRKFAKLALITARFQEGPDGKRVVHVSAPGMDRDLKVEPRLEGERIECGVWHTQVKAIDQGDEAAQWFTEFIGHGSVYHRLVASAESSDGFHRLVDNLPPGLKEKLPPMKVALADSAPVTLISEESLADLNKRLKEWTGSEVPLDRFRMNIEITGCSKPFEEDEWLLVRIGSVPFLAYAHSERCKMTAVNQDTGEIDKLGPLDILRGYRAPGGPLHARFGQLMIPLQAGGHIRVGDTVQVIERKKAGASTAAQQI